MNPDAKGDELIDPEIIAMPERLTQHPLALASGAGGFLLSAVGAVGETMSDAAAQVPSGGFAAASWAGVVIAGIACYSQFRAAKRQQDAADAAEEIKRDTEKASARMQLDTEEYESWGGKFADAEKGRLKAEARLEVLEEKVKILLQEGAKKDDRIAELLAKLDHMNANVKHVGAINAEIGKHNAEILDEVKAAVKKTANAVQQLGSSSGVDLDTNPTPDPKG